MDVMRSANELAAAGQSVLHLEVGQPATPAPRPVIEAAMRALSSDRLGYTDALGLPVLRERISRHYKDTYDVDVPPERIIVTTGSSGGFVLAFLVAFDAGANVAVSRPGYPAYRNILQALGIQPVEIPCGPADRWAMTPSGIESGVGHDHLDGILVASPANPTGTVTTPNALAEIIAFSERRGAWLISDEIYHGITYGEPAATALAWSDQVIVLNSFSKYFSMTGWRVGWMVVPQRLVRPIERLAQNLYISVPTVSQLAATAAFDAESELEANVAAYERNRQTLLEELPAAGLTDLAPADGAFYIYADTRRYAEDSTQLCDELLRSVGVAATPGSDFDPVDGKKFVRFSYAESHADIVEAARRIKGFLAPRRR